MMYLLFREKNIMPSQYYFLPFGEKQIVRAFFKQEIDERKRELEEIEKSRGGK